MDGAPTELGSELGRVDRVAAVVAWAVAHPVEGVGGLPHRLEDGAQNVDVGPLAVGADEVGLPYPSAGQDLPHRRGVVVDVDPVADVPAVAVELGADAAQNVGDLARDELLHMLARAVVVGAVRDRGAHPVGTHPRSHEQVGGRLGGAVRGARSVGRLLGEAGGVVQRQVAVDLVGRDVVEAHIVPASRLQQGERAAHVGLQEGGRIRYRVVVVGLGGEVHAGVRVGEQAVDQLRVADVAHDELDPVRG